MGKLHEKCEAQEEELYQLNEKYTKVCLERDELLEKVVRLEKTNGELIQFESQYKFYLEKYEHAECQRKVCEERYNKAMTRIRVYKEERTEMKVTIRSHGGQCKDSSSSSSSS